MAGTFSVHARARAAADLAMQELQQLGGGLTHSDGGCSEQLEARAARLNDARTSVSGEEEQPSPSVESTAAEQARAVAVGAARLPGPLASLGAVAGKQAHPVAVRLPGPSLRSALSQGSKRTLWPCARLAPRFARCCRREASAPCGRAFAWPLALLGARREASAPCGRAFAWHLALLGAVAGKQAHPVAMRLPGPSLRSVLSQKSKRTLWPCVCLAPSLCSVLSQGIASSTAREGGGAGGGCGRHAVR